jgi:hypothetical protein
MNNSFDDKPSDFDFPDLNAVERTSEYELRRPIRAKLIQTQQQTFYFIEHFGLCALLNVDQFNTIFQKVSAKKEENNE